MPMPLWVPVRADSTCQNLSKTKGSSSGAMPMPVSATAKAILDCSRSWRAVTRISPLSVNLTALWIRFMRMIFNLPGSHHRHGRRIIPDQSDPGILHHAFAVLLELVEKFRKHQLLAAHPGGAGLD